MVTHLHRYFKLVHSLNPEDPKQTHKCGLCDCRLYLCEVAKNRENMMPLEVSASSQQDKNTVLVSILPEGTISSIKLQIEEDLQIYHQAMTEAKRAKNHLKILEDSIALLKKKIEKTGKFLDEYSPKSNGELYMTDLSKMLEPENASSEE